MCGGTRAVIMVETAVDEIPGLGVLDVIKRRGLDALGDLTIDLSLVCALGVRIFFCDLDVVEVEHSKAEHRERLSAKDGTAAGAMVDIWVYLDKKMKKGRKRVSDSTLTDN